MLVIYSKDNCQQCDSAKLLCQMKGVAYVVKTLGVDYMKEDLSVIAPNARSFPIVTGIVHGVEVGIGGLTDLKEFLKK
jgi:glutaredoxin